MRVRSSSRLRSLAVTATLVAGLLAAPLATSGSAQAAPVPVQPRTADTTTADVLPTVQVDGVVWAQVTVGTTVYVTGSFTTAKSAVSDPVQTSTPRSNLLAYDITTGKLISSFDVPLNGQGITLARNPDGSRVFVGGDFTTAGGTTHRRLVAINTATGKVDETFRPNLDARVSAIVATAGTVYVGGTLGTANSVARSRFAAFNATTGALLAWAPTADRAVKAMVLTPDGSKLIVGGQFEKINGSTVYGLAAISPTDGTSVPWSASGQIRAYGANAAVTSLRTDGQAIYGTGYSYGGIPVSGLHEFEGTFAADPTSGQLIWLEDCHGDSYDVYSTGSVVYSVSHAHDCSTLGSFPQTALGENRRALAFSAAATGTLAANTVGGYKNWVGTPSPTMYTWFPDLKAGTFTGQSQAAWSVVGTGAYVSMGGEFPTVNGVAQSGLVRFATRPTAPGLDGPRAQGSNLLPSAQSLTPGSVRVQWQSSWDRDDRDLTYTVVRNGDKANPVYTVTAPSFEWSRPMLSFQDTGLTPGATATYRIYASDADGNQVQGDLATVTVSGDGSAYRQAVLADQPSLLYRLGEASGTAVYNSIGFTDAVASAGVTRAVPGAIAGDPDTASRFSGSSTGTVASSSVSAPSTPTYTVEAWIRTTSSTGGAILNLGNKSTGLSSSVDRMLYLDNAGRVLFGTNSGAYRTVMSPSPVNNGVWHHIAATVTPGGTSMYVDGVRVATRADAVPVGAFSGFWRLGGDNLNGWPNKPSSSYLAADIDDVAVYPTALTARRIVAHATAGGKTVTLPAAPADAYGAAVSADNPEVYWRLNAPNGSAVADSSLSGSTTGSLSGGYTLNQAGALVGNTDKSVTFNGSNGFGYSQRSIVNPTTFSVEAWFRSSSVVGGKIIGLGNSQTGLSSVYDRQVFLTNAGKVAFGLGSVTVASPASYNNGAWHHVVASTSPGSGMKLYVDGALVGSAAAGTPSNTTGYWRIGGDTTNGSSSRFLAGSLDEVAVYSAVLPDTAVLRHYQVGTDTTPNTAPNAVAAVTGADLTVTADATGSNDPDGSLVAYSWNWGDGSSAGAGSTASHTYAAAGTYTITLTVTDNRGGTGTTTRDVVVRAPNVAPTAVATATADVLDVAVDGSQSSDPDGSITSWSWNWGDGSADGSGATATHTYSEVGDHTVTLTVTDDRGATATATVPVTTTAPPNQAPAASFTARAGGRSLAVDGSGSSDADGTVAGYSWNWGDGSPADSGVSASHTYASTGTYAVTLTVTDDDGATAQVSKDVVIDGLVVADAFARTTTSGWGTADTGGAWTLSGGASKFSTNGSSGQILLSAAGSGPSAALGTVAARDVDGMYDFAVDKAATGGGVYSTISTRKVGTSNYQFTTKFLAGGAVTVAITRTVDGTATSLGTVTVAGLTVGAGDVVRTRFQAIGGDTTTLAVKAWKVGADEPAAFALTRTDATAGLQVAGAFGIQSYLSGSSTNAPVVASIANLKVALGG